MVFSQPKRESNETHTLTLPYYMQSRREEPTPSVASIRVTSAFIDDNRSSVAMTSPSLPPESFRSPSPAPLLQKAPLGPEDAPLIAEPPPSFNPPAYRSVPDITSYPSWRDKYTEVPGDLEVGRFTPRTYSRIPAYGWRVWSTVVLVVLVIIIAIVVALTHTIGQKDK